MFTKTLAYKIKFHPNAIKELELLEYKYKLLVRNGINDYNYFKNVKIGNSGELSWNDEIDLCPDALYLKLTGKKPEDIFPSLCNGVSFRRYIVFLLNICLFVVLVRGYEVMNTLLIGVLDDDRVSHDHATVRTSLRMVMVGQVASRGTGFSVVTDGAFLLEQAEPVSLEKPHQFAESPRQ